MEREVKVERNQPVISIQNLSISIDQHMILKNVSLEAHKGRILGIIGESGCGKTMTCKAILGLLPPQAIMTSGTILMNQKDMTNLSEKESRKIRGKQISMVMQNPISAFNPVRTIESHFFETLKEHNQLSKKEARKKAIYYLEKVNLPRPIEVLKQYPFQLSGGMLQRVMIAIGISTRPDILIADEPTTALDTVNQKNILKQLSILKEESETAIILITHNIDVIAAIADDVAVMYKGNVIEMENVYDIFNQPKHEYTKMLLQSSFNQ